MRLIALDTHTPFIGGWCTILFIKSYSMTWSWKTYSLHLLNNLTGSWRNETIYTSFLWSQCHSYHDHGRARECRETLEILCRWNKYHFRNHLVLAKKFFHILPYGLQFTVPRGAEDPDCMRFQWIKMQQKTGWYFLVLSPNINAQVACRTHTFIFYFFYMFASVLQKIQLRKDQTVAVHKASKPRGRVLGFQGLSGCTPSPAPRCVG